MSLMLMRIMRLFEAMLCLAPVVNTMLPSFRLLLYSTVKILDVNGQAAIASEGGGANASVVTGRLCRCCGSVVSFDLRLRPTGDGSMSRISLSLEWSR